MAFHPVVRPPALRAGDCIGLAAPASAFQEEEFYPGVKVLQDLGFRVHYTPRLFEKHYYLAGSDTARAAELNALFADPAIKAIFCCRGGYGAQRLLPYLDTATIMAHPKIFVGYSDLTTLLLYLYSQCHLVTLHGPVVVGDLHPGLEPGMLRQLQGMLTGDEAAMQPPAAYLNNLTVLRAGEAEGRLLSCCLSLLVCAVGTPFQPQTRGTLVFLEDRGERLYAIDRMLTYLKLAGVLQGVRGLVVLGEYGLLQVDHSPYRSAAHQAAIAGGDPLAAQAAMPDVAARLLPLPLEVIYELGLSPAVRLAAGGIPLTGEQLDEIADACWRAISLPD